MQVTNLRSGVTFLIWPPDQAIVFSSPRSVQATLGGQSSPAIVCSAAVAASPDVRDAIAWLALLRCSRRLFYGHKRHAELTDRRIERLLLVCLEVATGLGLEHCQGVDQIAGVI